MEIESAVRDLARHLGPGRWGFTASGVMIRWLSSAGPTSYEVTMSILALARATGTYDGGVMSAEFEIGPGGYRCELEIAAGCSGPGQVVSDPAYRYPGRPLPGSLARPPAAAPSDRPTDPAVLAEVTALFEEFVTRYAEIRGEPPRLPPGATEAEIAAAEAAMDLRLPEDLRALYRMAGADPHEVALLGRWCHLPLDKVVEYYLGGGRRGAWGWHEGLFTREYVVFEPEPYGRVHRYGGHDFWVTFAVDFGMNYAFTDLDPAPGGTYGQLLSFGRDVYGPCDYLDASVLDRLRRVVGLLRDFDPTGVAGPDDEDDDFAWPPHHLDVNPIDDHDAAVDLSGRTLPEALAGVPRTVQSLTIRADRSDVDLSGLAGWPHLRELSILRAVTVSGRPDPAVPLESLEVTAGRVDLSGLAGHPALWSLTLGDRTSADLSALKTIPHLVRLELREIDADPAVLAGLPNLKVLIATPDVWNRLREADTCPPGLAAAANQADGLAMSPPAWTAWLAGHMPVGPPDRRTFRG